MGWKIVAGQSGVLGRFPLTEVLPMVP